MVPSQRQAIANSRYVLLVEAPEPLGEEQRSKLRSTRRCFPHNIAFTLVSYPHLDARVHRSCRDNQRRHC